MQPCARILRTEQSRIVSCTRFSASFNVQMSYNAYAYTLQFGCMIMVLAAWGTNATIPYTAIVRSVDFSSLAPLNDLAARPLRRLFRTECRLDFLAMSPQALTTTPS